MAAADQRDTEQWESDLKDVRRGLKEVQSQFLQNIDLLRREVLTEPEFVKANEALRSRKPALEARRQELEEWVAEQQDEVWASERMPEAISGFLEDFKTLDVRIQKARLQEILRAAYVSRDNRLELELRS